MRFERAVPLKDIAIMIDAELIGNTLASATGINEIHKVEEGDLVFVDHPKNYDKCVNSAASFIIINKKVAFPEGKALLIAEDPFEAYLAIVNHFRPFVPSMQNPEALKFYFLKRSNKLRVLATEPILIANQALGYNLRYQLDSFVYHYNTDINLYRGYCLYSEMEGSDSLKKVWAINRTNAYYGSKLQFMRSYYDSTLASDGWVISMLDENNNTKFNKVADPYDTLYYGALDSTFEVEVWYPRKISVNYAKKKPEPEYIKKFKLPKLVSTQTSYIDLTDAIAIKENGYYYDQKDWINQGYWSWKNLGDQLPYDFVPPFTIDKR